MIHTIKEILNVSKYTVICKFNTNEVRSINLEKTVKSFATNSTSILNKLNSEAYFKTVKLDSYGTLNWNDEIDFCPHVLYAMSMKVEA
jgi:hypothetical protein